jgi:hypothetical protein
MARKAGLKRSRLAFNKLFDFLLRTCRLDDQMRFRCPKRFDEDYYCHLSVAQICHWAGISKRQYDRAMHELEEKVGVVERKLVQRRTEKGEPYFTLSFRLVPVVIREFLETFQTKELAVVEFDDYGAVTTKKGAVSCRTQKGMTLSTQNSPDPGDCSAPLIDVVDGNEQTLAPEARAGISFCEDQVPDVQRKRINVSPETREIVDILQRATIFDQRLTERQVRKINRLTRLPFAYALTPERASLFADMRRSIRLWVIPESHWVQKVDAEFFCNNWKAVWKVMKRYRHYTDFKRSVNMDEAFDAHGTANHFLLKTFENLASARCPVASVHVPLRSLVQDARTRRG